MNGYKISLSENLNLITIKNISYSLRETICFLEENDMCLVTCNIKPSGFTDMIFSTEDRYISKIAMKFKSNFPPHNSITVRSGVSRLSISKSSNLSTSICKLIVDYFDKRGICIERIIFSKREIQLFFPHLEVCGNVKTFVDEFENYLQKH